MIRHVILVLDQDPLHLRDDPGERQFGTRAPAVVYDSRNGRDKWVTRDDGWPDLVAEPRRLGATFQVGLPLAWDGAVVYDAVLRLYSVWLPDKPVPPRREFGLNYDHTPWSVCADAIAAARHFCGKVVLVHEDGSVHETRFK